MKSQTKYSSLLSTVLAKKYLWRTCKHLLLNEGFIYSFIETRKHGKPHLTNLFESFQIEVGKDVAVWLREYLKGHSTVVVLQRGDVIVPHGQLCACINLIPAKQRVCECVCGSMCMFIFLYK